MQRIKQILAASAVSGSLLLSLGGLVAAHAVTCPDGSTANSTLECGANSSKPTGAANNLFGTSSVFVTVSDILIFLVGAIAVIMLIIGGLRYVLSSGNSSAVEGAKNTILYAIIGIVVAVLAYAAVHFVVAQLSKAT